MITTFIMSCRGQGIGKALWSVAMARMTQEHPDALIVLYSVFEQVERYKKAGFVPVRTIQRWYIPSNPSAPLTHSRCTVLTKKLIPALNQYNKHHYFINQALFFELLQKPETNGLVFMDDNVIKGFGLIRRCVRGFRIGSLVADTPDIAKSLIAELLVFAQSEPVFIDVPNSNPHGVSCMNAFHAVRAPQKDTITMIKGTGYSNYLNQREQQYGLFSLEIG